MAYIDDIQAFVEVADQGSFTRAAAYLFISQPALSRRIGRLMFAPDPSLPLERALPAVRQPSLPAAAQDDFPGNAAARVLKLVG